jgi:hypothetical protein
MRVGSTCSPKAQYEFDQNGRPFLQTNIGPQVVNVGISAQNVLTVGSSPELIQALLAARLQSELRRSSVGKVSNRQTGRDLQLLQMAMEQDDALETSLPSPWPCEAGRGKNINLRAQAERVLTCLKKTLTLPRPYTTWR